MKPLLILHIILFWVGFTSLIEAQTYTHPTTSIQGEFVGSCLEATCSGTYRDNGNNSNYSNNINQIYRVFCPNAAGQCLRVTFNSFDVEDESCGFFSCTVYDYLTVGNGPTQNSPVFTSGPANASGQIFGTPATPFSYTSTDASGCLTFRFTSDGSVTRAGWSATLSCVPCAGGPNGTDNNDCINATPVCSNVGISNNATGPGIIAEGCSGSSCPAGGENHTNWYAVEIQTSGTLTWTIDPTDNNDDYDFAMYGPNVTCGSLGSPIRCSDAGVTGNTGLSTAAGGTSEDVFGDGFVSEMNVTAGQTYYLVVDEWSPNAGSGYNLNWGGTASLDCTVLLPVKLTNFGAVYNPQRKQVDLNWITAKEHKNEEFVLERSFDGITYEIIDQQASQGNSHQEQLYTSIDKSPTINGINYYRLQWTNQNGQTDFSEVVAVAVSDELQNGFSVQPNPFNDYLNIRFEEFVKEKTQIQVLSPYGQVVKTQIVYPQQDNNIALQLQDLQAGIYILNVQIGDQEHFRKIVKTN